MAGIDDREKKILLAVIQSYINLGFPVGSRYLSKKHDFGLSSASIRNVMSDLEEMGYLVQPHTSSGRVPTDKGYRLFVEELLGGGIASNAALLSLLDSFNLDVVNDLNELINSITKAFSGYSHYLGVALSTTMENSILRKIEMFGYKDNMIVILLLTEEGVVRHKIVSSYAILNQQDLSRISSYLTSEFGGVTLKEIRNALAEDLYKERAMRDDLLAKALEFCKYAIFSFNADVFITGMSELINLPDFCDVQRIKELSRAVEDKVKIVGLLDDILEIEGVQVFIGSEAFKDNEALSVVASTFYEKGRPFGVFGLIGPQRMDYASAISIVDTSAKFMSKHLDNR
ncbi:MAG: heat-inducible transcription repressor HrcA [Nitrospirae bacterium]|nr:heat-inducible transcription repressor HrcA [Nitrospirota bacterium]